MFAVDAAAAAEAALGNEGDVCVVFVINAVGDLRNFASAGTAVGTGSGAGGGNDGGDEA